MKDLKKIKDIKRILVITLSNIGDVILTLPVMDILKRDFPDSELSIIVGPKAQALLEGSPVFQQVFVYRKQESLREKWNWICQLRKYRFDMIVDLRNTAIPFLLNGRNRTSVLLRRYPDQHILAQHLNRLKEIYPYQEKKAPKICLGNDQEVKLWVDQKILECFGSATRPFAVIGPSAADQAKRWSSEGFAEVCDDLASNNKMGIVFIGDRNDQKIVHEVRQLMKSPSLDLSGKTSLKQLAGVLEGASLTVVNDSAPMHMASYLDTPTVALFGQTNPKNYGPWGAEGVFIRMNEHCPACQEKKEGVRHQCLEAISSTVVLEKIYSLCD